MAKPHRNIIDFCTFRNINKQTEIIKYFNYFSVTLFIELYLSELSETRYTN